MIGIKNLKLGIVILIALSACGQKKNKFKPENLTPRIGIVPLIKIFAEKEIEDDPKTSAKIQIVRNDSILFTSPIGIELRGALSLYQEKKSFGLELRDSLGNEASQSVLGLPKGKNWILSASYSDHSLVRNTLAYQLSNEMGRYAARTVVVELELNGEYQGVYIFAEKLSQNENRINIKEQTSAASVNKDVSGGYILKIDKTSGSGEDWSSYTNENSFQSKYTVKGKPNNDSPIHYLYEYPKAKNITIEQKQYIQSYVNDFERVMASGGEEGFVSYADLIDADSFVDYFLLTELMQNHDGYRISTFLTKDKNGKLAMGPIWDCDLAFGADMVFCSAMAKDNWVFKYNNFCPNDAWLIPFWWEKLVKIPAFKAKLVKRWNTLRKSTLSDENIQKVIVEQANYLQKNNLVARNYQRWSDNKDKDYIKRHQKHIDRILSWTKNHAAWMDREILKL